MPGVIKSPITPIEQFILFSYGNIPISMSIAPHWLLLEFTYLPVCVLTLRVITDLQPLFNLFAVSFKNQTGRPTDCVICQLERKV